MPKKSTTPQPRPKNPRRRDPSKNGKKHLKQNETGVQSSLMDTREGLTPLEGWLRFKGINISEFAKAAQEYNPKLHRPNVYSYMSGRTLYDRDATAIAKAMRQYGLKGTLEEIKAFLRGPRVTISLEVTPENSPA